MKRTSWTESGIVLAVAATVAALSVLSASSCIDPRACSTDADCPGDQICRADRCLESEDAAEADDETTDAGEETLDVDDSTADSTTGGGGDEDANPDPDGGDEDDDGGDGTGPVDTDGSSESPTFVDVSGGDRHSCGLLASGKVACWGSPDEVVEQIPDASFESIAGGNQLNCGVTEGGALRCWGDAPSSGFFDDIPDTLGPGGRYATGSGSGGYPKPVVCVYDSDSAQTIQCFGEDDFDFGIDPTATLTDLAVGADFACVSTDASGDSFQCDGPGSPPIGIDSFEPPSHSAQIDCSGRHCCAVGSDGSAECVGGTFSGVDAPEDEKFDQIAVGNGFSCGRRQSSGEMLCWGEKSGLTDEQPVTAESVDDIASGQNHACALLDGAIGCWGGNGGGQTDALSPQMAAEQ